MRVAALSTCAISPLAFKPKALLRPCREYPAYHGYLLQSKSYRRRCSIGCSIKSSSAHFGHSNNLASYLNTLVDSLRDTYSEKIKEFPWRKARSIASEQFFIFAQKALKWSVVLLFGISFLSDIFIAVSKNRELLIPLGLFIGVTLADFLKESFQELFQNRAEGEGFPRNLLGVGSFFVFVKLLSLCFNVQGRIALSHIGNGGLMQVLWLARELQRRDDIEMKEEQPMEL
ncbi:uncharacterized protein A4U43_C03F24130 [Asparagus officinalis]|uniref:Uncharacterized protein n=1 Tax=Asparagus officinalis TaxID=4686 RepID=A0A5P1FGV1_ASPOF|nr:uncharacterized protein LOC109834313 [Asparagus officinalis]ONK76119.1 uncharacterized protein A4U43_C03F24130 [Asparagus officinalis]